MAKKSLKKAVKKKPGKSFKCKCKNCRGKSSKSKASKVRKIRKYLLSKKKSFRIEKKKRR